MPGIVNKLHGFASFYIYHIKNSPERISSGYVGFFLSICNNI